jgi:hypothetical protein
LEERDHNSIHLRTADHRQKQQIAINVIQEDLSSRNEHSGGSSDGDEDDITAKAWATGADIQDATRHTEIFTRIDFGDAVEQEEESSEWFR